VAARVLAEWDSGIRPIVVRAGAPAPSTVDARANLDLVLALGDARVGVVEAKQIDAALESADLVIDALFGVGLARPIEGELRALLERVAGAGLPVLAVDVPSGLASDTGDALGFLLPPTRTLTFGLPKLGLALSASRSCCRRVPRQVTRGPSDTCWWRRARPARPVRARFARAPRSTREPGWSRSRRRARCRACSRSSSTRR
jgi:NAD(P)H-hydrate epimerase